MLFMLFAAAAAPAATLVAKPDLYGGMIIDHEQLPNDPEAFAAALTTSLQVWLTRQPGALCVHTLATCAIGVQAAHALSAVAVAAVLQLHRLLQRLLKHTSTPTVCLQ